MNMSKKRGWLTPALLVIAVLGTMIPSGCGNSTPADSSYYLRTNQQWVEGLSADDVNIQDIDEVFGAVFSRLPQQITVYPSENYYYFALYVGGREFWGNIRLPAGKRENGVLSFAYFEFDEFPTVDDEDQATYSNLYNADDGVIVKEIDPFKWTVGYKGKTITFNLHKTGQELPAQFELGENEIFIERTFDESGYQFFLLFHEDPLVRENNYFFWVLNQEDGDPDVFETVTSEAYTETDIIVGRRSGFAFWVDTEHDSRKVLASIRQLSVMRNDYYDGPFDQLADNYVYTGEVDILTYFIKALPAIEGRVDKYGYYTDTDRPLRVALSAYGTYYTNSQLISFVTAAKASSDVYHHFSSRGSFSPTVNIVASDVAIIDGDVGVDALTVIATYSESMDKSQIPVLTFNPALTTTLTNPSGTWSVSDTVYTWTYDIEDAEVTVSDVDVTVDGGKDLAGNTQVARTNINYIDVDTT